jgi:hypothetical protein
VISTLRQDSTSTSVPPVSERELFDVWTSVTAAVDLHSSRKRACAGRDGQTELSESATEPVMAQSGVRPIRPHCSAAVITALMRPVRMSRRSVRENARLI